MASSSFSNLSVLGSAIPGRSSLHFPVALNVGYTVILEGLFNLLSNPLLSSKFEHPLDVIYASQILCVEKNSSFPTLNHFLPCLLSINGGTMCAHNAIHSPVHSIRSAPM